MEIYNTSLASVDFCIYKEGDFLRGASLYPGGLFAWASIAPGGRLTWDHGDRAKVQIEFRFPNGKRPIYILNCAPGVTIRPGMVIFNALDRPQAFDVKREIKHVVVLMLENRSFDNVLGWLYADAGNRPPRNIPDATPPTFDGLVENTFWNARSAANSPRVYATKGVTRSPTNKQPDPNPMEGYPSLLEQMFGVWLGAAWRADIPSKLEPGTVFRAPQGQAEYDHTSVLATIRDWIFPGGRPGERAWLPSQRVKAAPTLWPILTRATPRQAPTITPAAAAPRAVALAHEAMRPAAPTDSEPEPGIEEMTSIQLGLAVEAHAMREIVNDSPPGALGNVQSGDWQKAVNEAAALYRAKVSETSAPE